MPTASGQKHPTTYFLESVLFIRLLYLLLLALCFLSCNTVFAETKIIEGKVTKEEIDSKPLESEIQQEQKPKIIKSTISKDIHTSVDVQVLNTAIYYHPDADLSFTLLQAQAQRGHPHLLSYKEIDGLYKTALANSTFQKELKEWKYTGGSSPYYLNACAKIRNNGNGAMTDVKLIFTFEVKIAPLRATSKTYITDYKDLERYARWQKWTTISVPIKIIPPGEYMEIHTQDISLCSLLDRLKNQWPTQLKVKVNAHAPMDSRKNNNYAQKTIQLIPAHFVIKTLH